MKKSITALLAPIAMAAASGAQAQDNQGPPPGAVFSLTGQAQSEEFAQFSFSFVAAGALTNLTFAFRNDSSYLLLDDVSVSTGGGPNLVVNGGFEDGPQDGSAPLGWTYSNPYDAAYGGIVSDYYPHTGAFGYYDGATQAYDSITQTFATTPGASYDASFWAAVSSANNAFYQPLSTNGRDEIAGDGVDLFAYVADASPMAGAVPEPATWAMMMLGFGLIGGAMRRRRRVTVRYA